MAFSPPRIEWNTKYFDDGRPTQQFQILFDQLVKNIVDEFGALAAAATAQAAAAAAQASAATAQTAAGTAQTAATTAQTSADGANSVASFTASGTTGLTLTAADAGTNATITISAHSRVYGSGTTVAVNAGSLTGLAFSTTYFIYYDQASRAGGAVTYASTTSEATAAQTGNRHLVGKVLTPADAAVDTTGSPVKAPGLGAIP